MLHWHIPWQDRQQRCEIEGSYTRLKYVHRRVGSIEHLLFSTSQREFRVQLSCYKRLLFIMDGTLNLK